VTSLLELSDALQQLVSRASPAVVGVEQGRGAGTGVVVASDGYLLTNHHVAGNGRALRIRLSGGETTKGELVGSDPATDLAVVKVTDTTPVQLPLADPSTIAVGQLVVAIGNPFRFERSVSLGIVSALDRSLPGPNGTLCARCARLTDARAAPPGSEFHRYISARPTFPYTKKGTPNGRALRNVWTVYREVGLGSHASTCRCASSRAIP